MALPDLLAQGVQRPKTLMDSYLERAAEYRKEQMAQQELGMRQQDLASQLEYRKAQMAGMQAEQGIAEKRAARDAQADELWGKWEAEMPEEPSARKEYIRKGIQMAARFDPQKAYALKGILDSYIDEEKAAQGTDYAPSNNYKMWMEAGGLEGTGKSFGEWVDRNVQDPAQKTRAMSSADKKLSIAFVGDVISNDPDMAGIDKGQVSSLTTDIVSRADEIYSTNPTVSKRQAEEMAYQEIKQGRVSQTLGSPPVNVGGMDIPFTGSSPTTTVAPRQIGAGQTKVINGVTYVKVPGGWQRQ